MALVESSNEITMSGLMLLLKNNAEFFCKNLLGHSAEYLHSILTLKSVSEIYLYSITNSVRHLRSMDDIKERLREISQRLLSNFANAKDRLFGFSLGVIKANDVG